MRSPFGFAPASGAGATKEVIARGTRNSSAQQQERCSCFRFAGAGQARSDSCNSVLAVHHHRGSVVLNTDDMRVGGGELPGGAISSIGSRGVFLASQCPACATLPLRRMDFWREASLQRKPCAMYKRWAAAAGVEELKSMARTLAMVAEGGGSDSEGASNIGEGEGPQCTCRQSLYWNVITVLYGESRNLGAEGEEGGEQPNHSAASGVQQPASNGAIACTAVDGEKVTGTAGSSLAGDKQNSAGDHQCEKDKADSSDNHTEAGRSSGVRQTADNATAEFPEISRTAGGEGSGNLKESVRKKASKKQGKRVGNFLFAAKREPGSSEDDSRRRSAPPVFADDGLGGLANPFELLRQGGSSSTVQECAEQEASAAVVTEDCGAAGTAVAVSDFASAAGAAAVPGGASFPAVMVRDISSPSAEGEQQHTEETAKDRTSPALQSQVEKSFLVEPPMEIAVQPISPSHAATEDARLLSMHIADSVDSITKQPTQEDTSTALNALTTEASREIHPACSLEVTEGDKESELFVIPTEPAASDELDKEFVIVDDERENLEKYPPPPDRNRVLLPPSSAFQSPPPDGSSEPAPQLADPPSLTGSGDESPPAAATTSGASPAFLSAESTPQPASRDVPTAPLTRPAGKRLPTTKGHHSSTNTLDPASAAAKGSNRSRTGSFWGFGKSSSTAVTVGVGAKIGKGSAQASSDTQPFETPPSGSAVSTHRVSHHAAGSKSAKGSPSFLSSILDTWMGSSASSAGTSAQNSSPIPPRMSSHSATISGSSQVVASSHHLPVSKSASWRSRNSRRNAARGLHPEGVPSSRNTSSGVSPSVSTGEDSFGMEVSQSRCVPPFPRSTDVDRSPSHLSLPPGSWTEISGGEKGGGVSSRSFRRDSLSSEGRLSSAHVLDRNEVRRKSSGFGAGEAEDSVVPLSGPTSGSRAAEKPRYTRQSSSFTENRVAGMLGPRVHNSIKLDVARTFPSLHFYQQSGKQQLQRILEAVAFFDPEVCYVQGLNFLAAALLWHCGEEDVFWLLVSTMYIYDLRCMLKPGLPGLKMRCRAIHNQCESRVPLMLRYLTASGVAIDMIITGWLMTLFASVIPLPPLTVLWDSFYREGWVSMYRLILHRFAELERKLLAVSRNAPASTPPVSDLQITNLPKPSAEFLARRRPAPALNVTVSGPSEETMSQDNVSADGADFTVTAATPCGGNSPRPDSAPEDGGAERRFLASPKIEPHGDDEASVAADDEELKGFMDLSHFFSLCKNPENYVENYLITGSGRNAASGKKWWQGIFGSSQPHHDTRRSFSFESGESMGGNSKKPRTSNKRKKRGVANSNAPKKFSNDPNSRQGAAQTWMKIIRASLVVSLTPVEVIQMEEAAQKHLQLCSSEDAGLEEIDRQKFVSASPSQSTADLQVDPAVRSLRNQCTALRTWLSQNSSNFGPSAR